MPTPQEIAAIKKENELINRLMGILDTEKNSKIDPFETIGAARVVLSELQNMRLSVDLNLYEKTNNLCLYITPSVKARNVALNIANPLNGLSPSRHSAYYESLKTMLTSKDASRILTKDDVKNWVIPVLLENLESALGRSNDAKQKLDSIGTNPTAFTPEAMARARTTSIFIPQEQEKEKPKPVASIDPNTPGGAWRKKF